ncbi:MAG: transketolase C-terminal domain-containing protein, partial [Actinomycetota bacterium]|nr:transketolase C-terminal domain-containing protein [Actinomycetota bacterium]
GVGEDGPTHQPVEQLAALRAIPNLLVMRPADANETAVAWHTALSQRTRPVAFALTRQKVPTLDLARYPQVADGVARGGYVLEDDPGTPSDVVLVASGSEVALALEARKVLGNREIDARVVSMPCVELFAEQPGAYRHEVVPPGVPVVSVEAGIAQGWCTYLGAGAVSVSIDRFGASAPGDTVMRELGMTVEAVVAAAEAALAG